MQTSVYVIESQVEETHWWFRGRRKLLAKIISGLNLEQANPILDIGTGTGTNLRLLKELGFNSIVGVDNHDEAIHFCEQKGLGIVKKADICNLPFDDNSFDLILATDVIEHVEDDLVALKELNRVLSSNGRLIITVPAFQLLWGLQDEVSHHKRRYIIWQLRQLLAEAGFDCEESFYFNYILFVPIWLARQLIRHFKIHLKSESQLNSYFINWILSYLFTVDVITARFIKPFFGVSIFALVRK